MLTSLLGIQICATLDGIPMVNKITDTKDTGTLMLRAAYSTDRGLTVGIALPLAMNVCLIPSKIQEPQETYWI